jgi:type I restriction enzyme M protein
MTYWAEIMQDDAYIITVDGWVVGAQVVRLQKEHKGKKKDIEGLPGLEGRLIPTSLLISMYFAVEQTRLNKLNVKLEQIGAQIDELKDKHSGDEGLLAEVIENDKISKGSVQRRIKEIKDVGDFADEFAVLQEYAALFEREAETKKAIKEAEKDLERKMLAKYPTLSLEEIKALVVERKWMDALEALVQGEVDSRSRALTWYRNELRIVSNELLPKWQEKIGVRARSWGIKRMKTRWGTCSQTAGRIWLNLELAKKPIAYTEYIIVHELLHLIEKKHNKRFVNLMTEYLPKWRSVKEDLNRFLLSHEEWNY